MSTFGGIEKELEEAKKRLEKVEKRRIRAATLIACIRTKSLALLEVSLTVVLVLRYLLFGLAKLITELN
ncbi:9540_t:CDS:2 [Entrophospora sp. SA101]|nr:9540_t:CDS:2 [Entrophospora sp. SA101]